MEQLIKRLQKEIARTHDAALVDTVQWTVPMQRLTVTYAPVERLSMDILMKMLLMAFHELHVTALEQISELLAVEHLFVADLTETLLRNELVIREENGVYTLTPRGQRQLADGVLEDALNEQTQSVLYSALHDAYFTENADALLDMELPEPYEYVEEPSITEPTVQHDVLLPLLQQHHDTNADMKTYVTSIKEARVTDIIEVPCIAFVLYNEHDDAFSARVWNTLLNRYDDVLETHYREHAITVWRNTLLT